MWLSKLIYTLLTLLCFWLQWDYTPTPLQAQTQTQTYRQAGKHFYKKGTLPPFQTLHFEILGLILSNDAGWSSYFYSQRYFSRLWIMTFITQTLLLSNTELCFLYTAWPVVVLVSAMSMMVPTLASTWSLLLTTPGATLAVSPPSLQPGSSSRARAETSNNQVREVLANMFLPREEFLDFILEIIFLNFWFFSV